MTSRFTLLPGQSVEIAAPCTLSLQATGKFHDGAADVSSAELLVDGAAATVAMPHAPLSDAHAVEIVAADPQA